MFFSKKLHQQFQESLKVNDLLRAHVRVRPPTSTKKLFVEIVEIDHIDHDTHIESEEPQAVKIQQSKFHDAYVENQKSPVKRQKVTGNLQF